MTATVAALRSAPVKGLAQHAVDALTLDERGVVDDRRFAVVRASGSEEEVPCHDSSIALDGGRAITDGPNCADERVGLEADCQP